MCRIEERTGDRPACQSAKARIRLVPRVAWSGRAVKSPGRLPTTRLQSFPGLGKPTAAAITALEHGMGALP